VHGRNTKPFAENTSSCVRADAYLYTASKSLAHRIAIDAAPYFWNIHKHLLLRNIGIFFLDGTLCRADNHGNGGCRRNLIASGDCTTSGQITKLSSQEKFSAAPRPTRCPSTCAQEPSSRCSPWWQSTEEKPNGPLELRVYLPNSASNSDCREHFTGRRTHVRVPEGRDPALSVFCRV